MSLCKCGNPRSAPRRPCRECEAARQRARRAARTPEQAEIERTKMRDSLRARREAERAVLPPHACADCGTEFPPNAARNVKRCKPCRRIERRASALAARAKYTAQTGQSHHIRYRGQRNAASRAYKARVGYTEAARQADKRRRARKVAATTEHFTTAELHASWRSRGIAPAECVYCGAPAEHDDHVTPLSRGGAHAPDNLVPACADCNLSKHDKTPEEWFSSL